MPSREERQVKGPWHPAPMHVPARPFWSVVAGALVFVAWLLFAAISALEIDDALARGLLSGILTVGFVSTGSKWRRKLQESQQGSP